MRLFVHDLPEGVAKAMMPSEGETAVIGENGPVLFCNGCRKCDYAPEGTCAIRDGYENMAETLLKSDELCIVSRLVYGGFSPFVKSVFDRSRGVLSLKKKPKSFSMRILFYGDPVLPWEELTAREMAEDLKTVLGAKHLEIAFTKPVWEEN